ncbi:MAG: NCS2 family permease [Magnetospirillum sp. WYHS-4]
MLDRFFRLRENGTTVRTELMAGLTTFLTMAYIAFVNPQILSQAGMDPGAVFVATCLGAAFGTLVMGLYANYPIGLAPGMGINAYFTFGVVLGMGLSWQVALGTVFVSGILFVAISLAPVREWIIDSIPMSLKISISAGIGLFLAVIGLTGAGIVVDHPVTLVALGKLSDAKVLLAIAGFIAMVSMSARGVPAAVLIAVLGVTAAGWAFGLIEYRGLVSLPPSLAPTFLKMDLAGALDLATLPVIFAFLFVKVFDTTGTLIGVAHRAGMLDKDGKLPRLRKALLADSSAATVGAVLGTSPVTSYIESASGIQAGGRTGLTAVAVGALFLLCLFFAPLAGMVPAFATAPALLFVACLMARGLAEIDWQDMTEAAPALVTALGIPLTYSISTGIGLGFITYAAVKILAGRTREAGTAVLVLAAAFVAKFVVL